MSEGCQNIDGQAHSVLHTVGSRHMVFINFITELGEKFYCPGPNKNQKWVPLRAMKTFMRKCPTTEKFGNSCS